MQTHGIGVVTPLPKTCLDDAAIRMSDVRAVSATNAAKSTWFRLLGHGMVIQVPTY